MLENDIISLGNFVGGGSVYIDGIEYMLVVEMKLVSLDDLIEGCDDGRSY